MNTFKPIIIIPARMNASRFFGKPLKEINGIPMIVKIFKQAERYNLAKVLVAAGDKEIYDCVKQNGGDAILTNPHLQSGTDRVASALEKYDLKKEYNIIVNLQGDLAVFDKEVLEACINGLKNNPEYDISTVCTLIKQNKMINDNNTVKAVISFKKDGEYGTALYFTRSTCPYGDGPLYQHIGVYGYKRSALNKFINLAISTLEKREGLEQLRALEAGLKFVITVVKSVPLEVNTKEDLSNIIKNSI